MNNERIFTNSVGSMKFDDKDPSLCRRKNLEFNPVLMNNLSEQAALANVTGSRLIPFQ